MWLLGRLATYFKTIEDFIKDDDKGIKNTWREFIDRCHQMKLFDDAVAAIDSSKIKAVNSKDNNDTHIQRKLQFHISELKNTSSDDKPIEEKITALKRKISALKSLETHRFKLHGPDKAETLRVSGSAKIVRDQSLSDSMTLSECSSD